MRTHLLGLVSEAVSLISAGGFVDSIHLGQLTVLPGPDTEEETKQVGLLLPPQLLNILVGTHEALQQ